MTREEADMGDGGCGSNAAPYVLGALTEAEHEAFATHLQRCSICREEVASLRAVTAALPAAAPQVQASRQLKRRVMAAVSEEQSSREGLRIRGAAARPAAPRRGMRLALAGAAAAVLAAVVVAMAGSGGSGVRIVRAQVTAAGASAQIRLSGNGAQLEVRGMPQVRRGRVYEVWLERGGAPQPTDALFTVSSRGAATVAVPGSVAGVRTVLVTAEPIGGSRVPTSSPVLVAHLE